MEIHKCQPAGGPAETDRKGVIEKVGLMNMSPTNHMGPWYITCAGLQANVDQVNH